MSVANLPDMSVPAAEPDRVDVLGVHVSAVDMSSAVELIAGWVSRGERQYVCITGVHGVIESQSDVNLMRIHNEAGLVVPDGMPMVWAGRYAGSQVIEQVRGSDLMITLCERAAREGWRVFLYGGAPDVLEPLERALVQRCPGLQLVGSYSPPFRPLEDAEKDDIVARLDAVSPDIVWVGLSTPKQERWMSEFRGRLRAPVLLGCGAAFDMNAGRLPQAPEVLRRFGLEWAYRVYREPRRLWRRYAQAVPAFLLGVLRRPPRRLTPHG